MHGMPPLTASDLRHESPSHPAEMQRRPIYLDNHATTPVDPRVTAVLLHHLGAAFGNASSRDHDYGDEAEAAVAKARRQVADLVGVAPRWVVFTSGATESLNLALQGFVRARRRGSVARPVRIALPRTEHHAVLETAAWLAERGEAELLWLPIDSRGRLDIDALQTACRAGRADLLCVMAANNEVGTVHPVAEIARIAAEHGVIFMTDSTQAAGKIPLALRDWGVSLAALTAHKMYGPKGVGALIADPDLPLEPLFQGGGHQRGLRPGTLNVAGIAALGEACRLRGEEMEEDEARIAGLRDRLQELIVAQIPGIVINGDLTRRLAGNLHLSVPDIPNAVLVANVRYDLALATGSACSSATESPSHVLTAMGLPREVIRGSLRIGLGKFTTSDEVDAAAERLAEAVVRVRERMQTFAD
jgi:cysteine desulfurase